MTVLPRRARQVAEHAAPGLFSRRGVPPRALLAGNPTGVGAWFVGSAVVHDLVLVSLYGGADAALVTLLRRRPALATVAGVPWLNHLRVPTVAPIRSDPAQRGAS